MLNSRGRGSGGLLCLVRGDIEVVIVDSCDQWMLTKVSFSNVTIFVFSVYFNQKVNVPMALESLQALITNIEDSHSNPLIVLGGDFNYRIESLGACAPELVENSIFTSDRLSPDCVKPTADGVALLDFMSDNGFLVLNGRSPNDRPAQFTYVDSKGRSVIDLVFIKITHADLVSDFYVDSSVTSSDHFPIVLCLADFAPSFNESQVSVGVERLKWRTDDSEVFSKYLQESKRLDFGGTSENVDELNENFCKAIWEAARSAGMILFPSKCKKDKSRIEKKDGLIVNVMQRKKKKLKR